MVNHSNPHILNRKPLRAPGHATALAHDRAQPGPQCPFFLTCPSPNSLPHGVESEGVVVRRKGDGDVQSVAEPGAVRVVERGGGGRCRG
jgi:hypothetical protein